MNVGQAKTGLSKPPTAVEAGESVEIARHGVPVARLVSALALSPGRRLLGARGSMAGEIVIADDFEWSEAELDDIVDGPA